MFSRDLKAIFFFFFKFIIIFDPYFLKIIFKSKIKKIKKKTHLELFLN